MVLMYIPQEKSARKKRRFDEGFVKGEAGWLKKRCGFIQCLISTPPMKSESLTLNKKHAWKTISDMYLGMRNPSRLRVANEA